MRYIIYVLGLCSFGFASRLDLSALEGIEGASPAVIEGSQARLPLPFQRLQGWRYSWDLPLNQDWSLEDKIQLQFSASPKCGISQSILYLKSGEGWYRFPSFDVCKSSTVVFEKGAASTEGNVEGWSKIESARLSFLPAGPESTEVLLKDFSVSRQWGAEDLSFWGGFAKVEQLESQMRQGLLANHQDSAFLAERARMAQLKQELRMAKDLNALRNRSRVMEYRALAKQIFASLEKPDSTTHKAIWIDLTQTRLVPANAFKYLQWLVEHHFDKIIVKASLSQMKSPSWQIVDLLEMAKSMGLNLVLWYDASAPGCQKDQFQIMEMELKDHFQLYAWDGLQLDNWRMTETGQSLNSCGSSNPKAQAHLLLGQELDRIHNLLRSWQKNAKLSVAVYSYPSVAASAVAQDWSLWAKRGWVDEIYTWTLSGDLMELHQLAQMQKKALPMGFPHYVGLSLSQGTDAVDYWSLIQQMRDLREQGIYGLSLLGLRLESYDQVLKYLP